MTRILLKLFLFTVFVFYLLLNTVETDIVMTHVVEAHVAAQRIVTAVAQAHTADVCRLHLISLQQPQMLPQYRPRRSIRWVTT